MSLLDAQNAVNRAQDDALRRGHIRGQTRARSMGAAQAQRIVGGININQKPVVSNEKLRNIVHDLYKGQSGPNIIGNGTTMDAVRHEMLTGLPTNGRFHTQKLNDYLNALMRRLRARDLNSHDSKITRALIEDIINALNGR